MADLTRWQELARKERKGADPESLDFIDSVPGAFPFVRGLRVLASFIVAGEEQGVPRAELNWNDGAEVDPRNALAVDETRHHQNTPPHRWALSRLSAA